MNYAVTIPANVSVVQTQSLPDCHQSLVNVNV